MEIKTTVVEEPAFVLESYDYNGSDTYTISWNKLKNSKVGDTFDVPRNSNCGRDIYDESAKVVYKDETGCAILFTYTRTSDDPNPVDIEIEPKLQWFQFRG